MNTDQRGPDWLGLLGAALTVVLHLILQADGPSLPFIVGAGVAWTAFIVLRAWRNKNAFVDWGFRVDNLAAASAIPLAVFAVAAAGFAGYAWAQGTLHWPNHLALLLLLYPLWGLIQQFIALGIVVNNLERVPALRHRRPLLVLLGAALFGLVHAHDWPLVVATGCLELALIPTYLRHRNLLPPAVVHGWLGALFYLWVLDKDLWVRNFGGSAG